MEEDDLGIRIGLKNEHRRIGERPEVGRAEYLAAKPRRPGQTNPGFGIKSGVIGRHAEPRRSGSGEISPTPATPRDQRCAPALERPVTSK